jgi:NAD(P)H dehydrogenase (quinone)
MTTKPKILVTSASGNTGMPTTLGLLERGFPVRAFVRREDHRSKLLRDAGADVLVGNQYALADMRRAMRGVQRAYLCPPSAPNGLHFGAVFAVAAAEARIEHIVLMSQWLADPDHPSVLTRETWLNEHLIALLPEASVTVNNAGWFTENYFLVLQSVAQLGMFTMPLGDGDIRNNAAPSNHDIAAVNVEALIDPATHAGKVYRPTGRKLLSPNEIAATFAKVLGRKVTYHDISEAMLSKALSASGVPVGIQSQLRLYSADYRQGAFAVNAPTTVVADVTGRAPQDFETVTRHNVTTRPEGARSLANKIKAIRALARIVLTPSIDYDKVERERDHVLLEKPRFAIENPVWLGTHHPTAEGVSPGNRGLTVVAA